MQNTQHDESNEECEMDLYEGATCVCDMQTQNSDHLVYGENPSNYDGRLAGPSLDW